MANKEGGLPHAMPVIEFENANAIPPHLIVSVRLGGQSGFSVCLMGLLSCAYSIFAGFFSERHCGDVSTKHGAVRTTFRLTP